MDGVVWIGWAVVVLGGGVGGMVRQVFAGCRWVG